MTLFLTNLQSEMRDALRLARSETGTLSPAVEPVHIMTDIISRLQSYIQETPFTDQQQEINFFKNIAPRFYSRLFYYLKVFEISVERLYTSKERLEASLKDELTAIEKYYYRHEDLTKLLFLKDTRIDDRIFIRNEPENPRSDEVAMLMDADYSVGCYYASRLYANIRLAKYIKKQLHPTPPSTPFEKGPTLIFTDQKINAGEVIILFFLLKCFNDGKAQLKEIVEWFELHANVKVGNIHVIWQEITRRKKDVTSYLSRGIQLIITKAQEAA